MRKFFYLILSISFLFIFSCSSDDSENSTLPKACFTIPEGGEAGKFIDFDGLCSENAIKYLWNFGDGNTSDKPNPSHVYVSKGSYEVSLTITGAGEASDTKAVVIEITSSTSSTTHFNEVNEDEVWEAGIHKIFGHFDINDATVTIMPGAIIKLMEDASISVGKETGVTKATLIANGTADRPIIFTADTDTPVGGFYEGIFFGAGSSGNNSLNHCIIEYGGNEYSGSMVSVRGTKVTIENSTLRHSGSYGIHVSGEGSSLPFNNNVVTDYVGYAIEMEASTLHTLGVNNQFDAGKEIEVLPGIVSAANPTWKKMPFPYVFKGGNIRVGSTEGTTLTIEPGTVMKFVDGSINLGYYSNTKAKLIAEGTAEEPIVFTSNAASPAPGDWGGVYFMDGNDPASSMKYCTLSYGGQSGAGQQAPIRVSSTSVNINNCIIEHASPYSIWLNEEGYFASLENNTINTAANGISIFANWAHTIGTSNTINANTELTVNGNVITQENVTWVKRPYPYNITSTLRVGSETGSVLTLKPGVQITMKPTSSFQVGGSMYTVTKGGLIAIGTAEEPIIFTSAQEPLQAGSWEKVAFYSGTMAGTQMSYCTVSYSGGSESDGSILITETDIPVISNCTVQNSGSYGIVTNTANPTLTDNIFINNAKADYYSY